MTFDAVTNLGLQALGTTLHRVFASEAVRAQQTAEHVLAAMRAAPGTGHWQPDVEVADDIGEICMGGWTGKDKQACKTDDAVAARERDAWDWRPPGISDDERLPGESYHHVEERMHKFLESLLVVATDSDTTSSGASGRSTPVIAVFSHHAAIRCVLRALVEASPRMLSPKLDLANTAITELVYTADKTGRLGGWVR